MPALLMCPDDENNIKETARCVPFYEQKFIKPS
jgi:hypothetical protein